MITLKYTVLLVSMAFAGACAAADADADAPASTPMQARPTTMDNHGCLDANPGLRTITINFNQPGDEIVVAPPNAGSGPPAGGPAIHVGDVLQFHLVGADQTLVSISGKKPKDGWLNGSGKTREEVPMSQFFYVCVPRDLVPLDTHEEFYYNVDAFKIGEPEWPQLDPIVRVRNP
jgi:hypothetical protein